ncbi:hypothetical protein EB835_18755 [Brevibacterium sp. S22]|nr:hypothetical protein EB835_18755 [Brevibacterium sp. S22]
MLATMSESESPVLRLIPYLAAISAAIFAGLAMTGTGESNLLVSLVAAAVAYFGAYFIVKLIIHAVVTRIDSGNHDDQS